MVKEDFNYPQGIKYYPQREVTRECLQATGLVTLRPPKLVVRKYLVRGP
jgi:hypothetical protein